MKILNEFKEFIAKGNVVDMAVGVVVGGAFKNIIDSLVQSIIMPCIGTITGKVDITQLSIKVSDSLIIPYGVFLQNVLNFIIIAFSIFCVIKFINTMRDRMSKKEEPVEVVSAPTQEELLTEIRDLLKNK